MQFLPLATDGETEAWQSLPPVILTAPACSKVPTNASQMFPNAGSAYRLVCHTTTPANKTPTSSKQLEVAAFKNAATGFRCLNSCVLLSCSCESHWSLNTSLEIKVYTVTYFMEESESIWAPILYLFETWFSKDILISFTGHSLYEIRLSNNWWVFFFPF